MNKTGIKFFSILVITLVFMYAFSASYTSDSIDNISYVIALAVDLSEDGEHLQVTFEFMDTSSFASEQSSGGNPAIIDTVNAKSINSALNLINAYIGKEVNLAHCKVIVFSDKLAEKGIYSYVNELMNNIQIRPTTNIIICKGNAMEYIQNSSSDLEKILTKYYDIFPNTSEYTGYTSDIMIGVFYNYLTTEECGNVAILGGLNPKISSSSSSQEGSSESSNGDSSSDNSSEGNQSEDSQGEKSKDKPNNNISIFKIIAGNAPILGERGTENIGLAVLRDAAYVGDLTAGDTLCHTLISGEVNSFLIGIDDKEYYEKYIDISLFENTSPKITVDVSGENPKIKVEIMLTGRIDGIKSDINYSDDNAELDLDNLSSSVSKCLEKYILEYLKKTTSEFKCDIDLFYTHAKRNFLTIEDWKNYEWSKKYLNSEFEVSVNAHIYQSLLKSY